MGLKLKSISHISVTFVSLVLRPFTYRLREMGQLKEVSGKGLVNNSTLARIHGRIPAISVDERKNATLANQISNSTNGLKKCHDVIIV